MLKVLLGVALVGLWVYSVVDVILADRAATRTLPRGVWFLVALLLPILGGILWVVFGRPRGTGSARRRRGPKAPDDDPAFLRRLDDEAWQERMRRRRGEPPQA